MNGDCFEILKKRREQLIIKLTFIETPSGVAWVQVAYSGPHAARRLVIGGRQGIFLKNDIVPTNAYNTEL